MSVIEANRLHNVRHYEMASGEVDVGPGPWIEIPSVNRAFQVTIKGGRALVLLQMTQDPERHDPYTLDFGPVGPEDKHGAPFAGTRAYCTHEPWRYVRRNVVMIDDGASVEMDVTWSD